MCLEVGRVDHDRLVLGALGGQADQDPGEDAIVAPALPTAVERLGGAVFLRRVAPPQAIAIGEDYAAEDATVIDAGLAVALGKEWLETLHLGVAQPVKIAHHRISLRSLNHANRLKSMGLEPRARRRNSAVLKSHAGNLCHSGISDVIRRHHVHCPKALRMTMTTEKKLKRTMKPGRKLEQVRDGAAVVFLRDGYSGASVDDISREAQVSKATLYSYFPDKSVMFREVVRAAIS